jgi:hypothetical protein
MRHTAPTVAALKTFSISNPLDSVIPARRESIRDAERTESAKTGASTAQFGSCGGPDLTIRLVGNPTNAPRDPFRRLNRTFWRPTELPKV